MRGQPTPQEHYKQTMKNQRILLALYNKIHGTNMTGVCFDEEKDKPPAVTQEIKDAKERAPCRNWLPLEACKKCSQTNCEDGFKPLNEDTIL